LNNPEYKNYCPAQDPENGDFTCSKDSIFSVINEIENQGVFYDVRLAT